MIIASDKNDSRIPLPMPYGWFHVLHSHELKVAQSKPLEYFGQELVVFRTESGVAKVVDAYCPHMGAHLGYGIHDNAGGGSSVVGESIVCPFHGWQFDGEGHCTSVPYAKNMPPKVARGEQVLGSWQVREVNQSIFVWYHPEEIEPLFDLPVIGEAAADNDEWGEPKTFTWDISTHMQEIGENAVDAAHFHYVHGTDDIPESEVQEFDGHMRHGVLKTRNPTPRGVVEGQIENFSYGPGAAVVRFTGLCETLLLANLSPVSQSFSRAHYAFFQKKSDEGTRLGGVGDAIIANICQQMEEDSIIWNRKKFYDKPMLCDGDGPFHKFRKWYGQFLVGEV